MRDIQWFKDRADRKIVVTYPSGQTQEFVLDERYIAWLHESQESGHRFSDVEADPFEAHFDDKKVVHKSPNVCESCHA